jgi:hypothetical protein
VRGGYGWNGLSHGPGSRYRWAGVDAVKKALLLFAIFLATNIVHAQLTSGIIAASRSPAGGDWSGVGLSGGIPDAAWAQCGTIIAPYGTSGSPASPATINNALAACSNDQYLQLGCGTFYLSSSLDFQGNSYRVIRGCGANLTYIVFSGEEHCVDGSVGVAYAAVCMDASAYNGPYQPGDIVNWTANFSAATTSLTFTIPAYASGSWSVGSIVVSSGTYYRCASGGGPTNCTDAPPNADWTSLGSTLTAPPDLQVGFPIVLDQLDSPTANAANDDIFLCAVSGTCSLEGTGGAGRTGRGQLQIVKVTSISGSGSTYTIGINPEIAMVNWCNDGGSCAATLPQAWWGSGPLFEDGIENLNMNYSITQQDQISQGIHIDNCYGCWVSGISGLYAGRSHIQMQYCARCMIQNSYFYKTFNTLDVSYGIETFPASDTLMQNIIGEFITALFPTTGECTGCVVAYNYAVNSVFGSGTNFSAMQFPAYTHSEGNDMELFEGNVGAGFEGDDTHGTHNMITLFRNAFDGYEQNNGYLPTSNTQAIGLRPYNRFFNIIGNVTGGPYTTAYYYTVQGVPSMGSIGTPDSTWSDPFTMASTMFWGNWDPISGTRWCGNSSNTGWATTCGGSSSPISTCTESGNTVTCNTNLNPPVAGGTSPNQQVTITGNSVPGYNVTVSPTVISGTSFQFTLAVSGLGAGSGGTATYGSQVPTEITNHANAVPSSISLPASFYSSIKPLWWPAGKPWPPIGPDVTSGNMGSCSGGTYAAAYVNSNGICTNAGGTLFSLGGHANSIPAMDCFLNVMGGSPIGTDAAPLPFNANACYTIPIAPAPTFAMLGGHNE